MRFTIIFLFLGIILLAATALFDVNYIDYKKPVPYSQWKTISFYDFKGLRKPGTSLEGSSEFAYINTSRDVQYHNNEDIQITSYFHPSRSYVFNQHIRSPDLLRHELYHFHITEYYSRLMRKMVLSSRGSLSHNRINGMEMTYDKMEIEMQKQYDEETYHSYVLKEQRKWETYLDSVLLSLADFSNPVVNFKK